MVCDPAWSAGGAQPQVLLTWGGKGASPTYNRAVHVEQTGQQAVAHRPQVLQSEGQSHRKLQRLKQAKWQLRRSAVPRLEYDPTALTASMAPLSRPRDSSGSCSHTNCNQMEAEQKAVEGTPARHSREMHAREQALFGSMSTASPKLLGRPRPVSFSANRFLLLMFPPGAQCPPPPSQCSAPPHRSACWTAGCGRE